MTIRSRDRKRSIHNEAVSRSVSTMPSSVFNQRNLTGDVQRTADQIAETAQAALNDDTRPDWMKPGCRTRSNKR